MYERSAVCERRHRMGLLVCVCVLMRESTAVYHRRREYDIFLFFLLFASNLMWDKFNGCTGWRRSMLVRGDDYGEFNS